jgi:hypothetical protein
MSNSQDSDGLKSSFELRDYVEATIEAGRHTSGLTRVLVVATVLIGLGWYNSIGGSWQRQRVKQAYLADERAACVWLECEKYPQALMAESDGKTPAFKLREQLRQEAVKAYVQNVRLIKAPIFDVGVDVNDLGLIGGAALIVIMWLLKDSLSREVSNLNVSLREAVHHGKLTAFYRGVAMRQAFTIPRMMGEKKTHLPLVASPSRAVCILPVIVLVIGVTYDYYSGIGLAIYSLKLVLFPLLLEAISLFILIWLAVQCWQRQSKMNRLWEQHWKRIEGHKSIVIRLSEDLVEDFGSDEAVDRALRSLGTET